VRASHALPCPERPAAAAAAAALQVEELELTMAKQVIAQVTDVKEEPYQV
jgi:hypothetical protein